MLSKYTMQWCAWTGEIQWEYTYHMANDDRAIDYASRHLKRLAERYDCVRSMIVYKTDEQEIIADLLADCKCEIVNRTG